MGRHGGGGDGSDAALRPTHQVLVATGAAAASALLPGMGQLAVGRRRRALPYLVFTVLSVMVGVWAVVVGPERLLELAVQPAWLTAAVVAIVVSLLVRVMS